MKKEIRSVLMQFRVTPTEAGLIRGRAGPLDLVDYLRYVVLKGPRLQLEEFPTTQYEVTDVQLERIDEKEHAKDRERRHGAG